MELDLVKLNHLLTIARTRSFSRAAEELGITQPTLSRSVAAIEQRFGFRLFDRGRSGASPTTIGERVLTDAQALVRNAKLLEDNMRLYGRGDAGKVTFGMGPLIASLTLAGLASDMLAARPKLQLRCSIKPAEVLLRELLNDEIEMMFCASNQVVSSDEITIDPVGSIELAMFARAGHPLGYEPRLRLADLEAFPFACAVELQTHHLPGRGGGLICDNFEILRGAVLGGDSIWLSSPQMVADDLAEGRLIQLPVGDLTLRHSEVAMVRLRARTSSPAAKSVTASVEARLAKSERDERS